MISILQSDVILWIAEAVLIYLAIRLAGLGLYTLLKKLELI